MAEGQQDRYVYEVAFLVLMQLNSFVTCAFSDVAFCVISGEGQYGKVYTCISVDTGELMAMKEVCSTAKSVQ